MKFRQRFVMRNQGDHSHTLVPLSSRLNTRHESSPQTMFSPPAEQDLNSVGFSTNRLSHHATTTKLQLWISPKPSLLEWVLGSRTLNCVATTNQWYSWLQLKYQSSGEWSHCLLFSWESVMLRKSTGIIKLYMALKSISLPIIMRTPAIKTLLNTASH